MTPSGPDRADGIHSALTFEYAMLEEVRYTKSGNVFF